MAKTKKRLAMLCVLMLIFTMVIGTTSAYAAPVSGSANDDVKIVAERAGDQLKISLVAVKQLNIFGLGFYYRFNSGVTYNTYEPNGTVFSGAKQINTDPNVQMVGLSNAGTAVAAAGDTLVSFTYDVTGGFQYDTTYTFSFVMDSVFDNNYSKYSWTKATFEVSYIEHTVSFNLNGGEAGSNDYSNQYVLDKETATDPGAPTRAGYDFSGWNKGENTFTFNTLITEKTELVAQWTPVGYNITYDLDGGTLDGDVANPTTYTVESEDITLLNPTKTGYTFMGWTGTDLDSASKTVTILSGSTGDRAYTATWTAADVTYTVKHYQQNLDSSYPTEPTDTETTEGITGNQTAASAKNYTGFTAKGFDQKTVAADGSTVVEIQYERNVHNVIYTVNGDEPSGATSPANENKKFGESVTVADALRSTETSKNGQKGIWTFSGWSTSDVTIEAGKFSMPDKDVTITGTWTFTPQYDVYYIYRNDKVHPEGDNYNEPTGEKNQQAGIPLQRKDFESNTIHETNKGVEGTWTFTGWTTTDVTVDENGSYTMPANNVTFTGEWRFEATTYTVKFVDEDGTTILLDEKPYVVGTTAENIEKPDDPTKAATDEYTYTFEGWTPAIADVTGNATYKATYQSAVRSYTITWVDGNGNTLKTDTVAYGVTPSYSGDTPTKTGEGKTYTFTGWSPEVVAVTDDATYTAQFNEAVNTYTITWQMDDGTPIDTTTVEHGATPTHADPNKAADADNTYKFTGWDPEVVAATGNTTYKATFTATPIPTYTITFVDEDGTTVLDTVTVKEGEAPVYGEAAPTKAEDENNTYTFNGWTPAIAPATGDTTYTATYKAIPKNNYNLTDPVLPQQPETTEPSHPETVTITWLNYDGSLIEKTTVAYNSPLSHDGPTLIPSAEGKTYTFKGWSPTIEEGETATKDAVYTAQFTATDDTTKETEDTTIPGAVVPENEDADPTNHEDLPKITTKDHTYEIYQIFTGDYAAMPADPNDENKGKKDVLSNVVWGQNGKDPTKATTTVGDPVDKTILDALNGVVNEELDRKKLNEIEKYLTIDGNPYRTITLGPDDTQNSIPLPPGYYLIRDVEGSHSGDNQDHDAYTTYITVVIKDYTIQPKSVIPTVDKQVYDNDDGSNTAGWAETADHAINERFQFALIGTIPENDHLKDYTNGYVVKFTDTMSQGVTFEDIVSVKVNDTTVSKGAVADGGYAVNGVTNGEAGKTWTIEMDVKKILGDSFGTGAISVVVTYNAHLNENAIVHTASDAGATQDNTNKNSVYLEYSNNPNTRYGSDMGKTQVDNVWVFTYEVDNIKRADSATGDPLAGAGFTLYNGNDPIKLIKKDTNYIVADQSATEGVVTEMTTDSTGVFNVKGLDVGTYTLRETTVPAGYNSLGDTTVTIKASHEETPTGGSAKLNLTGTNMNNTIINQSGSELPSTGGMGTTLFYILGSILAMGAGVLLVSRRRMNAN